MYAWHLTGLSTSQRSLQALLLSSDFRLRDTLLSGRPIRNHAPSAMQDMDGVLRQLSPRFDQIYASMLNPSQLKAVKAACVSEGFTLCQGEKERKEGRGYKPILVRLRGAPSAKVREETNPHVVLCCAVPCCAILCCAMLCYAVLCCMIMMRELCCDA